MKKPVKVDKKTKKVAKKVKKKVPVKKTAAEKKPVKKVVAKKPVKKKVAKKTIREMPAGEKLRVGDAVVEKNGKTYKAKKHPGGRPATTVAERIENKKISFDTVFEIAKTGVTEKELARILGVTIDTITRWKKDSVEFLSILKEGKDYADSMVEHSLYKRATGYTYDSEDIKIVSLGSQQGSEVVRVPIKVHHPPDTTAMIFWLKNRKKEEWRDKFDYEHGGKDGGPIKSEMSIKQFEKIARKLRDEV